MAAGRSELQARFNDPVGLLGDQLAVGSVYRLLADEGRRLFGVDYFAHLFTASRLGRPTVLARVIAPVLLLQVHGGLSNREACDRLVFDLR